MFFVINYINFIWSFVFATSNVYSIFYFLVLFMLRNIFISFVGEMVTVIYSVVFEQYTSLVARNSCWKHKHRWH